MDTGDDTCGKVERVKRLFLAIALVACRPGQPVESGAGRRVQGSPADVRTAAGVYDGYRVVRRCPLSPNDPRVGVVGTGTRCLEGLCDGYVERIQAAARFSAQIRAELPHRLSLDGFGARCTPGERMAIQLYVYDWRSVDEVIRHVGEHLRGDGLGEEVVVQVAGDPVPE